MEFPVEFQTGHEGPQIRFGDLGGADVFATGDAEFEQFVEQFLPVGDRYGLP